MEYGKLRTEHTVVGQQFAVDEHGLEVIELSAAEYKKWQDLIGPIMEDWVKRANSAGLPGQEIMDMAIELDAKYSSLYGDYGK